MYQVLNWEDNFEGSRSKKYKNKTSCQMPTKHGLGYRRLIRNPNGPALFGAWCAMIQVLSRQSIPRDGYCTDDGTPKGKPLTADDLEILTDIDASIFDQLLKVACDNKIGWLRKYGVSTGMHSDSTVSAQCPLDLDLDLDSDLDYNAVSDETGELVLEEEEKPKAKRNDYPEEFQAIWNIYGLKGNKKKSYALWKKLSEEDKDKAAEAVSDYLRETPDPQFRKYFERYLSQRVFDDVLERKAQGKLEIPKSSGPVETYIDPLNGMHHHQQYNLDDDYAPGEKEELRRKEAERKQKEKEAFLNSPETKAALENLKTWVEESKKEGGQSNE